MKTKVSFVTVYDGQDIRNWSGCSYFIGKALENEGFEVEYVGSLKTPFELFFMAKKALYRGLNIRYELERDPYIVKSYCKQLQERISPDTEIIFSPSSIPLSFLETDVPKVFYTDATFAIMIDYYRTYYNLSRETTKNGNLLEKSAIDNSDLVIYSSDWAAESAVSDYGASEDKVKVVSFGANIESSRTIEDIQDSLLIRQKKKLNLLFIGVDWVRKGGEKVLAVAEDLHQRGIAFELHLVGIKHLSDKKLPPYVKNHGFISKKTAEGKAKMDKLFFESHFLLLPTVADCTPVVINEANSYGVPCLVNKTGGTPSLIRSGVNGELFEIGDSPRKWTNYILDTVGNTQQYKELALSSFQEYQNRLNWKVAGAKIKELLSTL